MAGQRKLTVVVAGDADSLRSAVRAANSEMDKLGSRTDKLAAGLDRWGKRAVAASGVAAVGLFKAAQAAGNLEQAVGGTEAVFKESAGVIDEWAKGSAENMGLSERAFREATTSIGGTLKRLGYSTEEAAEKAVELTQVGADLAATYGGTTAEAVHALGRAFVGEADPAEQFNLGLKQSAVNAKAVALGLAESETAVSDSAKAQATYALIMEQSTDAQGQFARESDTLVGKQQILAAQWEELQANLGEGVMPILSDAVSLLSNVAAGFNELDSGTQAAIGKLAVFGTGALALGGTLSFVAGKVIDARERFQALFTTLDGDGNRSLNRAGAALGVAGIAGAIFAAASAMDALVNKTKTAGEIASELARVTGEELIKEFEDQADAEIKLGKVTEAYTVFARENLGAAIALRDAYAAQGKDVTELSRIIDAETAAQRNASDAASAGADAVGQAGDAADGAADKTAGYTAAIIQNTYSLEDQIDALERQFDAMWGFQGISASVDDAIADFTETTDAAGGASGRAAKQIDLVAKKQEALEAATDAAESALDSWLGAIEATEDANKSLLAAQKELDKALKGPSADDREDAIADEAEARRDLEEANWAVEDAEKKLQEAQADGDPREIARAENDLERARERVRTTTRATRDAQAALNEVMNWAAQNDPKVVAAQDGVTDAQKRLDKATKDAAEKWGELTEANQKAVDVANASLASFGASDAALYNNRLNVNDTKNKYLELRDAIKEAILATLNLGLSEAETLADLDAIAARIGSLPGLDQAQRDELLRAVQLAKNARRGPADTRVASEYHSGGTFMAPTPGGSGWAWLQDGEKVSRPAHAGGGNAPVVIVKVGEEALVSAQARYNKRGVATVIAG